MFGMDIVVLWAIIIIAGVLIYVTLDGFDLGIGILFPFVKERSERDQMIATIAPIWDGNETWMILGGAGLFAAFPLAYSVILSALYLPATLMVLALIYRGVAFEFRERASIRYRNFWDISFAFGSFFAAFFQGVIAGAVVSGFAVKDQMFVGGALDWVTTFNGLAGIGLVAIYALLGSTWLIKKTEGKLQESMRRFTPRIELVFLLLAFAIFIWSLASQESVAKNWSHGIVPSLLGLLILLLIIGAFFLYRQSRNRESHLAPFFITLGILILGFLGLGISIWPNVLPHSISIWEAAAPMSSLKFTLVGVIIFIPLVIIYNCWTYYIFKGKVTAEEEKSPYE